MVKIRNCISVVFLMLMLLSCVSYACHPHDVRSYFDMHYDEVTLSEPLSIEQIESKEVVIFEDGGEKKALPFGRINSEWEALKKMYQDGDCLIHFRTGEKSWKSLFGREGYLLVRNNEVVQIILTKVN